MSNPLEEIYLRSGHHLPQLQTVGCLKVPLPYRDLLVHDNDMTPTLEKFHGKTVSLKVMERYLEDNQLLRMVVLVLEDNGTPVEFGAIRIDLNLFENQAIQLILEGNLPLGTILGEQDIPHIGGPTDYFSVLSDPVINRALRLTGTHQLYGRWNVIRDSRKRTLAEMTEILPPVAP